MSGFISLKFNSTQKNMFKIGFLYAAVIIAVVTYWTDRSVDYWATYFKGELVDVNMFWSFLLSFTGPVMVIFNIITEILRVIL